MVQKGVKIEAPSGKLGVLIPGLGAVSTTFIAGVEAIKKKIAQPVGSLTQLGTIRLGKRTERRVPKIHDFVPLASLEDLVFGGWDIYEDNCYESASKAGVLEKSLLDAVRPEIEKIKPWQAVFSQEYVKRLQGPNVKSGKNKMDLAQQVMDDIEQFRKANRLSRLVMIWCGSTEAYMKPEAAHASVAAFEKALGENDPAIAPSMIYAYAALCKRIPFANGAPNLTVDIPALTQLAQEKGMPICGKDFKTGQTLMKTILAPGLKSRMLGLNGWFSTNILGNRDGEVLDDPDSFKRRKKANFRFWIKYFNRSFTRTSIKISRTKCESTITPRGATIKKDGITSTFTDGLVIPCRSRLISCAATAFSPRRSFWTSCYSSILRNAVGCVAYRNG